MIPISKSQDSPGPMAQTVLQASLLLDVLTGKNEYVAAAQAERSLRVGVVKQWMTTDTQVNDLFETAVRSLSKAGISIVEIDLSEPSESDGEDEFHVMLHEMVSDLAMYLDARTGSRVLNLSEIVEFNRLQSKIELEFFGQEIFEKALELGGRGAEYEAKRGRNLIWANQTLETGLHNVDVLIGCTYGPAWISTLGKGDDFGSASWITTAPAIAGTPIGTVPMGLVNGLPVGLGFVVGRNMEHTLITAMAQAEKALNLGILKPTFIK